MAAYEELVRTHQALALRTAYVVAGPDEAEDAVQEAFVKAYRGLPGFRPGSPFRPWLLRIVANESINRRRAAGRALRISLLAERERRDEAVESPESAAVYEEEHEELIAAVSRLRPADRLVIAYRYWFDLSEEEMARALGCRRGTVKSRLSRALSRLREDIARSGGLAFEGAEEATNA